MDAIGAADAAMVQSGYDRIKLDHYPTLEWVTEAIVPYLVAEMRCLDWEPRVWEPACGDGAMAKVLERSFANVRSSDIADYGYGETGVDFLAQEHGDADLIVTNPPYSDDAERFLRHALALTKRRRGAVAMVMRNEFDCAKSRVDLFNSLQFALKLVLTTRPRWIAGTTGSPRHNYAWYMFSWRNDEPARVHYHVLSDPSRNIGAPK